MTIQLDALRLGRSLVAAGMPQAQAEGTAAALAEALREIGPRIDSLRLAQRLRDVG